MRLRMLIAVTAALIAVAGPTTASAAPVGHKQAVRLTKRAASQRAVAEGITLPASRWTAACYRAGRGRWRCEAGAMGGYCNAHVYISGTARRPIAKRVDVYCFD